MLFPSIINYIFMQTKIREAVMGSKIGEAFHSIAFRYFLRKSIPKSHCGKHSYILTPSWVNKGGGGQYLYGGLLPHRYR